MPTTDHTFELACRDHLARFFVAHPDPALQRRAMRVLRLMRSSDKPLTGKVEGWAAGIIYVAATDGHIACGVPGILNSEFEQLVGVTMSTIRKRAARVKELIIF